MRKIKIVTDSTADLTPEMIEKYKIHVVPLSISIDGQTYIDGVDLTKAEFAKKLVSSEELPKSSQPSVGSFVAKYEELSSDEETEVLSIHLTEGMSGTFNAAQTAAKMADANVTVVNSKFISIALGFQVVEAAKQAEQGATVADIVQHLEQIQKNTSLYIMVDTLEYLAKGGRIGRGRALLGSLLKIKPIASLADGVYTPVAKVRTHMQMIELLKIKFIEETKEKNILGVGIAHIEAEGLATKLKDAIQSFCKETSIFITETSPIISTHTGPGAIALMYYTES
ncbi:DegV family protein [Halalkalibacterium ligniniphilum]|uniref:DegV family protein n=1 Tax=Halalkalibacterium ligniniphilum TaxID=1134413 RepID=UPI0003464CE3|nr:DegV family protein [Halalkalibacterium ligniniphilum]